MIYTSAQVIIVKLADNMKVLRTMLPLAVAAVLAVGASVHEETHERGDESLLSLWPAHVDAKLSVNDAQDASKWTIEATHGSILAVETTATSCVKFPEFDASNISSVQVTWVAPNGSSSTWQRVAGAASVRTLPVVFSAGVHVHVVAQSSKQDGIEVEAAVRSLLAGLKIATPNAIEQLRSGLFARSLCASTVFTEHHTHANESCFSASFPFDALPVTPPTYAWTQSTVDLALRVHSITVLKAKSGDKVFGVDSLSVSETQASQFDVLRDLVSSDGPESVAVVTEFQESTSVASARALTATGLQATTKMTPLRAAVKADASVEILGEGFHRQVRVRLSSDANLCPYEAQSLATLRLVLPLSAGMYADLDELRRMERFGELTLHSPAKHIEIERPMAVSSQHAIALDFALDASKSLHEFGFPIHLRYQSPTNGSYYSPATMMAPEMLVSCGVIAQHPPAPPSTSVGNPVEALFSTWLGTQENNYWQRIAPPAPLAVDTVLVPVGFVPHGGLVSGLTITVTSLGALLLGYVAITTSRVRSSSSRSKWRPKSD